VRYDQPDEAEMYYRAKRRPLDPSINPMRAYEKAEEQRLRMPRHSLALASAPELLSQAQSTPVEAMAKLPAWEFLGPGNVAGRMRGFVINPTNPNTMYVAGVSGGVWKTTDGGGMWATATDQLANIAFNSLAMNPANPNVIYGGTGEGYFREDVRGTGLPLRGAGIFVTTDAGATWSRLASTESQDFYWVNDLVVSRLDPRRVYAATRTGVWRSADEGQTWNGCSRQPSGAAASTWRREPTPRPTPCSPRAAPWIRPPSTGAAQQKGQGYGSRCCRRPGWAGPHSRSPPPTSA